MDPFFKLPPNQEEASPGKWPVVGEKAPRVDESPWTVSVGGLVENPCEWSVQGLLALPQRDQMVDIHCVTRWSKFNACFTGVPLAFLLAQARPAPEARYVAFVARSERAHRTSLSLHDALELDTLVAFRYEGEPLETIHGGPVRTVVPGRYFYKSLKWLERIELLAEDRLGYWEAETGYHNHADPWKEERYILGSVDPKVAKRALAARDFTGLDLLSMDASGRNLSGLVAGRALLRNVDFRHAELQNADFTDANLSNARLDGADLRGARFLRTDAEGASFLRADLRGADFTGASLFGATFCPPDDKADLGPAILDATTRIEPTALERLNDRQRRFVERYLAA